MTEHVIQSVNINKNRKGWNVLDCPSALFIQKVGEFFKEKNIIKLPKWVNLVKCGHSNEVAPLDADWLFTKAAAVARQIYISRSTNVGIGTLRVFFGKKKRGSVKSPRFALAGGKILREVVQQLKKNGYCENYATAEGNTLGLVLTKNGRAELDKIASRLLRERNVVA